MIARLLRRLNEEVQSVKRREEHGKGRTEPLHSVNHELLDPRLSKYSMREPRRPRLILRIVSPVPKKSEPDSTHVGGTLGPHDPIYRGRWVPEDDFVDMTRLLDELMGESETLNRQVSRQHAVRQ